MKTLKRFKTVLAVLTVSLMAATVMPSTASAEDEGISDEMLTVEVNLGPVDPDDDLCEGYASLTVPNESTMTAELARQELGNSDPSIEEVLEYFYESIESLQSPIEGTRSVEGTDTLVRTISYNPVYPVLDPLTNEPEVIDDVPQTQTIFSRADTNEDGVIDISSDADGFPLGMTFSRRIFTTSEFTVRFDADDCVISDKLGVVLAYRFPLIRSDDDGTTWDEVELENGFGFNLNGPDASAENQGFAFLLLRIDALNGQIRLPVPIALDPLSFDQSSDNGDFDPIAFGDEAAADMSAGVSIAGNSSSGLYQVQFGYTLEVFDYGDVGPGVIGCWLYGCNVN